MSYTYDSTKRLSTVTDAKNQRRVMTYDSMNRVTQVARGTVSGGTFTEDIAQRTNFYFDTNPFDGSYSSYLAGRLAAVQYCNGLTSGSCNAVQEWYVCKRPRNPS